LATTTLATSDALNPQAVLALPPKLRISPFGKNSIARMIVSPEMTG
jgi:hypothetical protein